MRDELLAPLEQIMSVSEVLQAETSLNLAQERFVQFIYKVSMELYELIVSVPDLTWDKAREILSYEARSHLSSVIGYAELLLEEEEGRLDARQEEYVTVIRDDGKYILERLGELEV